MVTRRRRLANVGNGNGARRRHPIECECDACRRTRSETARTDAHDAFVPEITLLCPMGPRDRSVHKLGTLTFDLGEVAADPHHSTRAEWFEHAGKSDYSHVQGLAGSTLRLSGDTRLVEGWALPRYVEWVCISCHRSGQLGANRARKIRTERVLALANAMRHRVPKTAVIATGRDIDRAIAQIQPSDTDRQTRKWV